MVGGEERSEVRKTDWAKRNLSLSSNLVALTTGIDRLRCKVDSDCPMKLFGKGELERCLQASSTSTPCNPQNLLSVKKSSSNNLRQESSCRSSTSTPEIRLFPVTLTLVRYVQGTVGPSSTSLALFRKVVFKDDIRRRVIPSVSSWCCACRVILPPGDSQVRWSVWQARGARRRRRLTATLTPRC